MTPATMIIDEGVRLPDVDRIETVIARIIVRQVTTVEVEVRVGHAGEVAVALHITGVR